MTATAAQRKSEMTTYTIDTENSITAHSSKQEAEWTKKHRRAVRLHGAQGGKAAAKGMTKAERTARAKKAAAASAKVRSKKAKARRAVKGE